MGRNNHASFSSRNKSNLQVLKNKIKIKGIKGVLRRTQESSKDEELSQKEDKLWKRFWWKWVSFVRGHRSDDGATVHVRPVGPVAPKAVSKISKEGDAEKEGCDESMDVIEIPIEPGQKISKILIRPTRTGIKAMIAHRRKPRRPCSRTPLQTDSTSEDEDARWTAMALCQSDGRLSDRDAEAHQKSPNRKMTAFKNGRGFPRTSETSLTSALFIRENMNDIVESAAFIEPTLPNDYADSKKSDDFSQKSTKINKRRVSYRILGDKSEEIRRTVKTVSEPTWMERNNIFHRRRLQDNINDLLEQFLFLETEDVVGLAVPRLSGPATDVKAIHFDAAPCLGTEGRSVKDICREVSPEILVNIKPFKEYLSDDQLESDSPLERQKEKIGLQCVGGRVQTGKELKNSKRVERAEECVYPAVKGVLSSKEKDSSHVLGKRSGNKDVVRAASSTRPCVEEPVPACTVRGVCRTYGGGRERRTGEEAKTVLKSESLDDFLNFLDDTDHDIVFQKNISQFRKKVSVVPRLDFKKSVSGAAEVRRKEYKKAKKPQSFLDFVRPIVECVAEESLEEEDWKKRQIRRMGAMALGSPKDWRGGQMWSKTLLTNVMLLTERNLVRRAQAIRMEEVMVSVAATWREMHNMAESGMCAVMQVERAGTCGERWALKKGRISARERNFDVVSRMTGLQLEDFSFVRAKDVAVLGEAIPQALPFIMSIRKCIGLHNDVMRRTLLRSHKETSVCDSNKLTSAEESFGICSRSSEGADSRRKYVLVSSEPSFEAVEILESVTFEHVVYIDDTERAVLPASTLGFESAFETISLSSAIDSSDSEKRNASQVDGFQILYNNVEEDLNDDDEDTSKTESAKSLVKSKEIVNFAAEDSGVDSEKEIEKEKGKEVLLDNNAEIKVNTLLKYKSSSSPKENIIQNEFGPQEPSSRLRRSLNLSKEFEKDFQYGKKRILSAEFRLESHSAFSKMGQDKTFVQKGESKIGTLMVSSELKPKVSTEKHRVPPSADGAGVNVRKEVVAAFNSIKEMSACKGETRGGTKRMSLVIMLCKK